MTEGASVSRGGGWSAPVLFASLRGYRRSWAMADVFAGVTLLAIAVPEQLATSRLAGMPPVTGLYAFVAGTAAFALLGANPRLSVGADSTIAPLFAIGVAHYASTGSHRYVDLVGILAVTVGAFVALVGVLRLGWIAEFLSVPIITGFLAGVAVVIVAHQLPDLFGLPATGGSTPHRLGDVFSHLGNTNGWTLGIGVAVLVMAVAAERVDRRLPAALFGLVGSGVVVGGLGLAAHGVVVLGHVTHSAPRWGLVGLSWSALGDLLPIAGVVALVVVSQSAATTRAFAEDIDGGHPDVNRDFLGVGAGSILAGLVGSFPVNASPVRTAAVASASGRSQAGGLGAAAAVILLIPAAGALRDVPVAALAAVLIFVAARLFRVGSLIAIAKFDLFEAGLALVTLLIVSLVGVEQGIAAAVGLAILDRTRLSARPQIHVLGRIPTTTSWAPIGTEGAAPVPGVLVVLFATPLWYANSVHFQAQLERALSRAGRPQAVVLDAVGMSDVDFTGSQVLKQVLDRFEQAQVSFAVARAGEHARRSMSRSGLAGRIGEDRFFASVDEAVRGLLPDPRPGSGSS